MSGVFRHHGKIKESLTISEKKQKVRGFILTKTSICQKDFSWSILAVGGGEKHGKLSFDEELVGEEK